MKKYWAIFLLPFGFLWQNIEFQEYKIEIGDTLESILFKNLEAIEAVQRFNRLDEYHLREETILKIPLQAEFLSAWTPLPSCYSPAKNDAKYILISLENQFLGGYENGKLKFSFPISTGRKKHPTPQGIFKVLSGDKHHRSNLYKDPQGRAFYMKWGVLFLNLNGHLYWIHRGPLPGFAGSHGCVRLREKDGEKLFVWVFGKSKARFFQVKEKIPVEIK